MMTVLIIVVYTWMSKMGEILRYVSYFVKFITFLQTKFYGGYSFVQIILESR